jgi:hypothetical protein
MAVRRTSRPRVTSSPPVVVAQRPARPGRTAAAGAAVVAVAARPGVRAPAVPKLPGVRRGRLRVDSVPARPVARLPSAAPQRPVRAPVTTARALLPSPAVRAPSRPAVQRPQRAASRISEGRPAKAVKPTSPRVAPKGHARGLSRTNRTVSRAQQRLLFARYGDAAKAFTSRGRYRRLVERKAAK